MLVVLVRMRAGDPDSALEKPHATVAQTAGKRGRRAIKAQDGRFATSQTETPLSMASCSADMG